MNHTRSAERKNRMKKRILSALLALCMVTSLFAANTSTALAASTPQLIVSEETAKPGEEVTLSLRTENNPGVGVLTLGIQYDESRLALVNGKDAGLTGWDVKTSAVWIGDNDSTYNGTILNLIFRVLDTAESGFAAVTVTCDEGDAYNYSEEPIPFAVVSGGVNVEGSEPVHTHTLTKTDAVAATCSTDGSIAYWTCSECGKIFSDAAATKEIALADTVVKATGHKWGEPTYTWAEDNSTVTAERMCANDKSHAEEETVKTAAKVLDATCTADGKTVYTADFQNAAFAQQSKTVTAKALGHDWGDWTVTKPATENEEGQETRTCKRCGETETRSIPKLDHTHTLTKTDAVAATCTTDGNIEYWSCTVCGQMFADAEGKDRVTDIVVKAIGHKWSEPTYTWAEDNSTVTAERVCANDKSHVEMETVHTTSKVTREATIDAEGERVYTAVFTNKAFAAQSKTETIAMLPSYTVSFEANGGPGTMEPDAKITGTYTLPACAFAEPEGKYFKAWSVNGEEKAPGETITVAADTTLAAVWETLPAGTYAVKVTDDGNGTASASVPYAAEGEIVTLTATPKDGYRFSKWEVTPATVSVTGNTFTMAAETVSVKVIFARRSSGGSSGSSARTYALTYETNGGSSVAAASFSAGSTVKLTALPVREGYRFAGWYADKALTEKITSLKLDKNTTVYAKWEKSSGAFSDVPEGYWAEDAIAWAADRGLMKGVSADTFAPGRSVTRQQLWMILARISGQSPANMAEAREWAMENGVSDGTAPTAAVSRQQMVAMLYRNAERMGLDVSGKASLDGFADAEGIASYARSALSWSVSSGIVGGTTATTLSPQATATRAQFAAILMRYDSAYAQ